VLQSAWRFWRWQSGFAGFLNIEDFVRSGSSFCGSSLVADHHQTLVDEMQLVCP
jgi:hypothetical protein